MMPSGTDDRPGALLAGFVLQAASPKTAPSPFPGAFTIIPRGDDFDQRRFTSIPTGKDSDHNNQPLDRKLSIASAKQLGS